MIDYTIVRSDRKTTAIHIRPDGRVEVRCPKRMKVEEIRSLVAAKEDWITSHLAKLPKQEEVRPMSREELEALAQEALQDIPQRVRRLAPLVGVTYGRITIRNQHSLWGSCSGKGNLNFNCLLMLAPEEVRDYVVVHELCHRLEMNHSPAFWSQVERVCPDYKTHLKWLKENGGRIMAQNR